MELNLVEKDGKTYTRFKVGYKEKLPVKMVIALGKPTKQSSRYTYYEVEGDLLNKKKE